MLRQTVLILLLAPFALAQAHFRDPSHLVPRVQAHGAVDPATGDLYLLGGRRDRVLDLWRLRNGSWEPVADSPFPGNALDLAFDAARQRLVAVVQIDGGQHRLCEFDGAQWLTGPVLSTGPQQVVYDPARQQLLVWSRIPLSTYGNLQAWNGSTLVLLPTSNVGYGPIGYDTARQRVIVARHNGVSEWNGSAWSLVAATWPDQLDSQLATDPLTGRVVNFAKDYWTGARMAHAWTGSQWTPWSTAGMPARDWPTLVGNAPRQRLQLVGGGDPYAHGDTYEFDGTSWQLLVADMAHPVFLAPRMAPTGIGTALLFDGGGTTNTVQTASFQSGAWTVLQPATAPSPRSGFALASNPDTGEVFLFGGTTSSGAAGDFWRWHGNSWQPLPGGPPARSDAALCVDTVQQSVVLYGGTGRNDSWEWSGGGWQQLAANFPPHNGASQMAYDAQRRRCVLVTFGLLGVEVWELDAWPNRNWISTNPPSRPTGFSNQLQVAYEPWRQRTIVVDPAYAGAFATGSAFEWDGGSWRSFGDDSRLSLATAIAGVPGVGLVAQNGIDRFATTLLHDHPAVVEAFGSSCWQPNWALTSTPPWLGRTLTLRYPIPVGRTALFAAGFSNTMTGTTPLPWNLGFLGYPSCHLYVDPLVVHARPWADGAASLAILLPNDPAFAGVVLHHQAFVIDQGLFLASQGLTTQLGSLW